VVVTALIEKKNGKSGGQDESCEWEMAIVDILYLHTPATRRGKKKRHVS